MSPTTLAYLAGLWDGEGSVAVYRASGKRFRLCVQLTQNSSRSSDLLVEELALLFGGSVTRTKVGPRVLTWKAQGWTALHFLTAIKPYVRLKLEELELAEAWAYGCAGDGEEAMRRLKWFKRSWHK